MAAKSPTVAKYQIFHFMALHLAHFPVNPFHLKSLGFEKYNV